MYSLFEANTALGEHRVVLGPQAQGVWEEVQGEFRSAAEEGF